MIGEGITVGEWLIPESELEERFDTYGGPGGQHANKTETSVTIRLHIDRSSLPEDVRLKLTGRLGSPVEVTVAETRSQWRNRELARDRLAGKLEQALADPRPRRKSSPPPRAREERLSAKRARSELKRGRRPPEAE